MAGDLERLRLADRINLAYLVTLNAGGPTQAHLTGDELQLIVTALRASSPVKAGETVAVRPLEWHCGVSGSFYGANSVLGDYSVWTYHGAGRWFWQNSKRDEGEADTLDAAKAAAQADFGSRIRSALVVEPVKPYGWIVKLKYGHDRWSGELFTDVLPPNDGTYKLVHPLYTATPDTSASVGLREALEKIAGHCDYDKDDYNNAAKYKRDEGVWSVDEYLADVALAAANQSDGGDLDARLKRLEAEAVDLGYVLTPEPEHPDSPHGTPPAPQAVEAVSVDELFAWLLDYRDLGLTPERDYARNLARAILAKYKMEVR